MKLKSNLYKKEQDELVDKIIYVLELIPNTRKY